MIPGAGDVIDVILNYTLVVRKARQAEIPGWLLRQMLMNNAVSAGVGLVPVAGDFVLAAWKANSRNAALLEEFLRIRGEELLRLQKSGQNPEAVAASNSTQKGKTVAPGVTQADAKQVKPGSGKAAGEVIGKGSSLPAPNSASSSGANTTSSGKSSGRGTFSWLRTKKAPEAGERGRFVENVDNSATANKLA